MERTTKGCAGKYDRRISLLWFLFLCRHPLPGRNERNPDQNLGEHTGGMPVDRE